ncbi:hypothetical protein ZIOFF_042200 [Zingiber officinale]|uniref:Uncharacterized protein n=2 Tax=Zingiber officinale TaxID=94328 RepID=A0A8J5G843_ZINOF|nr:hypothetical protein ZIOFF_042200 [Zingiber officinale]
MQRRTDAAGNATHPPGSARSRTAYRGPPPMARSPKAPNPKNPQIRPLRRDRRSEPLRSLETLAEAAQQPPAATVAAALRSPDAVIYRSWPYITAPRGANHHMRQGTTLREEKAGITQVDMSCILKTQHLQRLAAWASQEARISPLAALLGQKLASEAEASSIPLDSSIFLCERCETVLQPGTNCTIRIVKVANKKRRRTEKSRRPCQNKVTYTCHFCSHQNQTWGTAKGQVHALVASQQVQTPKPDSCNSISHSKDKCSKGIMISKELQHDAGRQNPSNPEAQSEPKSSTPERKVAESQCSVTPSIKLASKSSKKSNSGCSRPDKVRSNSAGDDASGKLTGTGSRKQQRRRSMSLRKMVENDFKEKNVTNFAIPFHL